MIHYEQVPPCAALKAHILVIDEDPSITSMLKRGLIYEDYQVTTASSGREALDLALSGQHDLLILGLMMPGMDGLEVCSRVRAAESRVPILVLSASDAARDQVQALQAGADDYVIKPFTFQLLLARVKALLRRLDSPPTAVLRFAELVLDTRTRSVRRGHRDIDLTSTEYDLLLQFLHQPRRVMTKRDLLYRVWGYAFTGNVNVLEVYVRYLRAKLEADGEPRLIYTIRGAGYLLREPRQVEVAAKAQSTARHRASAPTRIPRPTTSPSRLPASR